MIIIGATLASCADRAEKSPVEWPDAAAPVAEKKAHLRTIHGDTVPDGYYWLNDYFKKGPDTANVVAYLEAENAHTKALMAGTEDLQGSLFAEMKARIKETDESVPYLKNGYYYYTRTEEGKQYYKYCRKKGRLDAPEEILLDVDALAEGEISAPVKSQFGWHLITVEARRVQDMAQELLRMQARQTIFERRAQPAFENWLAQLHDQAYIDNRLEKRQQLEQSL